MESMGRPSADVVAGLTSDIQRALGGDLLGLYLYGSSVTGGFDVGVSDLDLVAITAPELADVDLARLERMHERFTDRIPEWRDRIEVVYVARATLESFRTSRGSLAVISPGEPFHVREDRAVEWLQNWYLVRETGVALLGPAASEVVPRIEWAEFVAATRRYAAELQGQSRVGVRGGRLAYTILTMCRALRVVQTQTTGSKQDGAAWTREKMPEWAWLIDAALSSRLARGRTGFEDERSRAAAATFISLLGAVISEQAIEPLHDRDFE